jgi:low temperature requirement protein LtrA
MSGVLEPGLTLAHPHLTALVCGTNYRKLDRAAETGERMTSGAAGLLRRPEEPRATYLELFFDLVFVFVLARLSQELLEHLSWSSAFQTLVLLLALCAIWANTARFTDRLDPQQPLIQLLVIATMFSTLLLAAAAPEAFGEQGLVFAGLYVATQVGRNAGGVLLLRGHKGQRVFARQLFWFGVSAVPWIAGALTHDTARAVLWALAVAVEYGSVSLGLPTRAWAARSRVHPSSRSTACTQPNASGSSSSSRSANSSW